MSVRLLAAGALFTALAFVALALASPDGRVTAAGTCSPARPHASGSSNETITVGSGQREYILHVPTGYAGASGTPLVFVVHPLGVSGAVTNAFMEGYTGMSDEADTAGFIAVYPKALSWGPQGNFQWNYSLLGHATGAPDDMAFFSALLDHLESALCVDTARVYSTGYSDGGYMSVRLGCSMSDRIAAIAPVAGEFFPSLPGELGCPAQRAVPIAVFQGTDDPIVSYSGNALEQSIPDEVMPAWADHNGCDAAPAHSQAAPGIELIAYGNCTDGADTLLYAIEDADGAGEGTSGGGHQWVDPVYDLVGVGPATHQIDGDATIWQFFAGHPLGGASNPFAQGDLDCNQLVDARDALLPVRAELALAGAQCPAVGSGSPKVGDVNCDGDVDARDSVAILEYAAGLGIVPTPQPGCTPIGA
ncbi:MAG TPA: PHB depolymerase family esterase [Dehalococcoidia bacterium]|jgi:polyhydroxybutyrate depolymerase|nr:PHB depolymerase family esterase [Dehalococcoidia bacterium]